MLSRLSQASKESLIVSTSSKLWRVSLAWISTDKAHHQAVLMAGDRHQCGAQWATREAVEADLAMARPGDRHNGPTHSREDLMTKGTASRLRKETSVKTTLARQVAP